MAGPSRVHVEVQGLSLVSFCSNDYLGLACDPRLQSAASQAAATSGFGAAASRLVSGTSPEHNSLENALATFLSQPAALLFPTGYQANLGVLTALAGADDLIVADRAVHASILDGCKLSRAKLAIFPHLDLPTAERHLARLGPSRRRRFLVTESLFSMDGDVAPLQELAAIASAHEAAFIVDEAHAFGIFGPSGRGLCAQLGVKPDILIATLGKAMGSSGAFAVGTTDLRSYLLNRARSFIFTTALPIPVVAAAHEALRILSSPEGDHRRARLSELSRHLRTRLFPSFPPAPLPSPILPLLLAHDSLAVEASAHLLEKGFFVQAIRPPAVPEGTARLRITLSSHHSDQDLAGLVEAIRSLPLSNQTIRTNPPKNTQADASTGRQPDPATQLRGIFLLGTDSSVGKTSVAVALLHLLATRGSHPVPFKPVETGAPLLPTDAKRLLDASNRDDIPLSVVCPIFFPDPVAPAAASLSTPITLPSLLAHARRAASHGGPLVVESAGGLLTPYATDFTAIDLAISLGLPILLVARNSLGTINHTALAIAELHRRAAPLVGIVLVTTSPIPTPDQLTNISMISATTGHTPLGTLPFVPSADPPNLAAALAANVDLRQVLELFPIVPLAPRV